MTDERTGLGEGRGAGPSTRSEDGTKTRAPEPRQPESTSRPLAADELARARRERRIYTTLGIALVCTLAMMVNYLAFRHYARWDWTSERRYTLSERSIQTLRELADDVHLYFFLSQGEPGYADVRELLDRYRAESSRIQVHYIDPVRQRTEYEALADRYGLGEAMFADGSMGADAALLVVSGDRRWTITRDDLVAIDFGMGSDEGPRIDTRAEQAITGGIVEVVMGRRTRICLSTGHGEWSLEGGSDRNLSSFRDEMRRENLEIEPFTLRGAAEIPSSCDAFFVVGPLQAFTSAEAGVVRDYVRRGGNLFVAADADIDRGEIRPTGLEEVLREFGVRLDRALVLEMSAAHLHPGQPDPAGPFYVTSYGDHPITRSLAALGRPTVFWVARPVRPVDPDRATVLFSASDQSFAETNIAALVETREPRRDDDDIAGPVALAVAVRVEREGAAASDASGDGSRQDTGEEGSDSERTSGGRVVVVGDAEFLRGEALSAMQVANLELASAIAGWLTARSALISIPPRRSEARPIQLSHDDAINLGFRVVVLMPLAVVFLGFAVWWNRRA